jgi:hypothetical protein
MISHNNTQYVGIIAKVSRETKIAKAMKWHTADTKRYAIRTATQANAENTMMKKLYATCVYKVQNQ